MSKKQNKKYARKKAEAQRNENVDKYLKEVQFPEECKKLPLEELSPEERDIAIRVRDHQPISDEEFIVIGEVLGRWRGAIQENDPDTLIKNAENIEKIITTETELLNILDQQEQTEIKFKYPLNNGKFVLIPITVTPLDDSRAVESVQEHLKMFKDIPQNERLVYEKAQRGEPITEEEEKIIRHVNKKLEEQGRKENVADQMNTFLAWTTELQNSQLQTTEEKKKFWKRLSFMPKMALYLKVRDMAGLTETVDDDIYFLD